MTRIKIYSKHDGFEYVHYKKRDTERFVYLDILSILGVDDPCNVDEQIHLKAADAAAWTDIACAGETYDTEEFTITIE